VFAAGSRLYVHEAVADEVIAGNGREGVEGYTEIKSVAVNISGA
jgi:hypothetical protein